MNGLRWMLCGVALAALLPPRVDAAATSTTTHAPGAHDLDGMMSNSDVLAGLIALELPGDRGWHSANTDPDDQLPAFTDGAGVLAGGLTGLLNDFPDLGFPTKLVQFDFAAPTSVEAINIFTGNRNNSDGRIFSTTVIRYSTNGGETFEQLGYFQSDPSGSINDDPPGTGTKDHVTLVSIFDDAAETLIAGVTNLQFDFYAVDNTQGQMRDPFDGENPFTLVDDGLTAAFSSPLVWEIDVLGQAGGAAEADFDGDGDVDGVDYLAWQRGLGTTGNATRQQGDSDGDLDVDAIDLANWQSQFGPGTGISAVPEPATGAGLLVGLVACLRARRRRRS